MPTHGPTDVHDLPVMEESDAMALVAARIQQLADAVDDCLPLSGSATVSVSGSASGSENVSFPAGLFPAPPRVVATTRSGSYYAVTSNYSTTGVTINVFHRDGTSATTSVQVDWIAVRA